MYLCVVLVFIRLESNAGSTTSPPEISPYFSPIITVVPHINTLDLSRNVQVLREMYNATHLKRPASSKPLNTFYHAIIGNKSNLCDTPKHLSIILATNYWMLSVNQGIYRFFSIKKPLKQIKCHQYWGRLIMFNGRKWGTLTFYLVATGTVSSVSTAPLTKDYQRNGPVSPCLRGCHRHYTLSRHRKQKISISSVITVAFDGLLRTEPPLLRDSAHASIGWTERHFWQRYPPPISGPCHRRWPLCFSVNRMTSGTSCSLSAPVGCGWADWTMTCVCENLCQGWGQIWGKTKDFSMRWILKCHELSWSLITSMKADTKKKNRGALQTSISS